jgi:hypothetical protein
MQSYLIAKIKSKYIEKVNITELNENDYYEPCENCSFFEEHSELRAPEKKLELTQLPPSKRSTKLHYSLKENWKKVQIP